MNKNETDIHKDCFIGGIFTGSYLTCVLILEQLTKKDMTIEKMGRYIEQYKNFHKIRMIQNSDNMLLGWDEE